MKRLEDYLNCELPSSSDDGAPIELDNAERIIYEIPPKEWDPQTRKENRVYQTGDLIIDRHGKVAFKQRKLLMLTPTEFEILLFLVDNHTMFCSRQSLIALISARLHHKISDNTLSKHICRVRKKIGEDGDTKYVLTQNSKGYKWNMVVYKRFLSREAAGQ